MEGNKELHPAPIQVGGRVTVLSKPGTVIYRALDGHWAVRLDGETRVDLWHPSQVEAVQS